MWVRRLHDVRAARRRARTGRPGWCAPAWRGPSSRATSVRFADVGTVPCRCLRCCRAPPVNASLSPARETPEMAVDLTTVLAGVEFANPVFTASGCAAAGQELDAFTDVTTLGGVVTKSVMRLPRAGRPTPRMAETASGMLNSIGLQGPGHRRLPRPGPAVAARAGRAAGRVDRRQLRAGVHRAGAGAAGRRRRGAHRGQHQLPERRGPRARLRLQSRVGGGGRVSGAAPLAGAGLREAVPRRHRHRGDRGRGARRPAPTGCP